MADTGLTPELFEAVQAARSAMGRLETELVQIQGGQDFKTLEDRVQATTDAAEAVEVAVQELLGELGAEPEPDPEPDPEPED